MKKFLDLFKLKKSKVVEELTKDFDKKVEATKKVNKEYSKNKINNDFLFKSLMNDGVMLPPSSILSTSHSVHPT